MMAISSAYRKISIRMPQGILIVLAALVCPPLVVGIGVWQDYNIGLVLAGIMVLALIALMFAQPEATTAVVLFLLYANLIVVAANSHNVPTILAGSVILLLGLPLLQYLVVRRQKIVINRISFLMLTYLGISLISAAQSEDAARSTMRISTYVMEGIILYLLIINTVRTPTVLRLGVWALLMAGVLMGGISLYQEVTGAYDNDFGGLSVSNNAQMSTGQVDEFGIEVSRGRMAGPVGEKNRYGQIMVVLLPLALSRLWAERAWWLRILGLATAIPILGGALLTFSRGVGVALVITLLAMIVLRVFKWWQLLIVVAVGYLFISLAVPDYLYRITTTTDVAELATGNPNEAGGSVRGRATENLAALYVFFDHPFLGVGPGQTNRYILEYGNEVGFRRLEQERRAHNMYLEELSDTGILGFSIFMSIIGLTMQQLFQVRRQWLHHPATAQLITGFILGLIAYLATAIFLHLSYMRYFWLILALAAAVYEIYHTQTAPTDQAVTVGFASQLAPLSIQQRKG